MLKLKNIFRQLSNKLLFLILILLIIVFLFYIFFKNIIIENFGGSNDDVAFDIPTLKKWSFEESKSWYKILKGGYKKNFSELGFTTPNSKLSILFLFTNLKGTDYWRNIFRFTNTSNDCCNKGDRIPALWVRPDNNNNFHVRFSTDANGNDGIDTGILFPMGVPILIGLVFDGNTFTLYYNNIMAYNSTFNNIMARDSNTVLQIADSFYEQDGSLFIKNFTLYDGALTQTDINSIYDKLSQGADGADGPAGPAGPDGPAGVAGPAGAAGPAGVSGSAGPAGIAGPIGPTGIAGPAGPIGPAGPAGIDGVDGVDGVSSENSSSNNSGSNNSGSNNSRGNFGSNFGNYNSNSQLYEY